MKFNNAYFITGNAYAGKSTMVKLLAQKYDGIACEEPDPEAALENYDRLLPKSDYHAGFFNFSNCDFCVFCFITRKQDGRKIHSSYKSFCRGVLES